MHSPNDQIDLDVFSVDSSVCHHSLYLGILMAESDNNYCIHGGIPTLAHHQSLYRCRHDMEASSKDGYLVMFYFTISPLPFSTTLSSFETVQRYKSSPMASIFSY